MKIKGSAIAAEAAEVMAKMVAAQAVLANIDEQRAKAEADLEGTRVRLYELGIDSFSDLRLIDGRREYSLCLEAGCKRVNTSYWDRDTSDWRCPNHLREEAKPAPAPAPAEIPF